MSPAEEFGKKSESADKTQPIDVSSNDKKRASYQESEPTKPIPTQKPAAATAKPPAATAEEERAAARERRRAEREAALGTKHKAVEAEEVEQPVKPKRTTDKFAGSLGLFILRVVTAGIIGLHALDKIMNIDKVQAMLNDTIIPRPDIMCWVITGGEFAIALGLLLGLLTRFAGLGLALVGIGALVFVKWIFNPFKGYTLTGETELLLGAIGLLFLFVGGGGWGVDAAFRRRRAASKQS